MEFNITESENIFVSMSLKDYSELKEMKDKIEKNCVRVQLIDNYSREVKVITKYYTVDEVVTELRTLLSDTIKKHNIEVDSYKTQVKQLKEKEKELRSLKNFSIWEFKKWRKNNQSIN